MKKLLVGILFLIVCVSVQAKEDDLFLSSFMSCTPYTEKNSNEMFGMQVKSSLQILGLRNGLCGFKSSISTPSGDANIECNFTEAQRQEMISSMQDNSAEIEAAARQSFDAGSQLMENPAVIIFNKYLNDTSVCTVTN